jgi:hypothetical protein
LTQYDPKNPLHEWMAVGWFSTLQADPDEFNKLFAKPLRNLTAFLNWTKNTVLIAWNTDDEGPWICAWIEPCLSGAYAGAWVSKKYRGTIQAMVFMNQFYKRSLEMFPVLLGLTKQPELHDLHLALGYEFARKLPGIFDGDDGFLYVMDRESRKERRSNYDGRRRRLRKNIAGNEPEQQRVHPAIDESVQHGEADAEHAVIAGDIGATDRRRQCADTIHRRKPRKLAGGVQQEPASAQEPALGIGNDK